MVYKLQCNVCEANQDGRDVPFSIYSAIVLPMIGDGRHWT